ncbi:MAG: hypothetical protein ABW044_05375 [Cellvibrio sp.]
MKYTIIILAFFSSLAFAQVTTVTSGPYKLRHNGVILEETEGSQKDAISAARALSADCHSRTGGLCQVAIQQPQLMVATFAAFPSSSSSSSVSNSSRSSSSVSRSSSSVSQLSVMTWQAPTQRVNGEQLEPSEIDIYILTVNGGVVELPGTETSYSVYIPSLKELPTIAVRDTLFNYSEPAIFQVE